MIEGRIQQEVAPFLGKAALARQHHAADAPLLLEQPRSPGHEANLHVRIQQHPERFFFDPSGEEGRLHA